MWRRHLRTALIVGVVLALIGVAFWKPVSVTWYVHEARELLRNRDSQDAVLLLQRAVEIDPQHAEVHYLLARSYRRLGQFERVQSHLDEAEGWGWPSDLVRLEKLMGAAQAGQLQASAPELYQFLGKGGHYGDEGPEVCEALVNGYFLSYQFGLAQPLLDEWQEAYPADAQCYMFRGLFHENRSNPTKAVVEYRKALKLAGSRSDVRLRLAQVLRKSNQFDEAIEQFEFCQREDSSHPEVLTGLGRCYRGQGRIEAAREMFALVLASDPYHFEARLSLGQLEETVGRPSEAIRWLRPACRHQPSDTEVRYSLGRSLQVVSREAREAAAWNRQPAGLSLENFLAWTWQWTAAELAHAEAAGHFQFVADAQQAMGRVQVWTDTIRSDPRNTDLRFKIGLYLMTYDNPEHGLGWMVSVLDIDPDHAPAHRALEQYYRKRGKIDRANQHLKQALKAEEAAADGATGLETGNEAEPAAGLEAGAGSKANDGESPDD